MKWFIVLGMFLSSVVVGASEAAPLTSFQGEPILGCSGIVTNDHEAKRVVVFRRSEQLDLPSGLFSTAPLGGVVLLEGSRTENSRGLTISFLPNEGTDSLPAYGDEAWTVAAPRGTFFSVRGNLRGVFLLPGGPLRVRAISVQSHETTTYMYCTSELARVQRWIASAASYRPF